MVQVLSFRAASPAVVPAEGGALLELIVSFGIIAIMPTVFWTVLICLSSSAYGTPLPTWVACGISGLILTFLIGIWAAFVARSAFIADPKEGGPNG